MNKKQHLTIQDIAGLAGVSKATVSRYLNGKYEYMSEETRKRIAEVIERTNYRPNKVASSLKTYQSNLVGLVLDNATSTLTPFLVGSICDACARHGRNVIVINSQNNPERERAQVHTLLAQQVEGLIVASGFNVEFYERLDREELPVILIDRVPEATTLDSVVINHAESTAQVVNHLIDMGYEQFITISRQAPSEHSTLLLRERAVADTCLRRFDDESHNKKILIQYFGLTGGDKLGDEETMRYIAAAYESSRQQRTALFVADAMLMGRVLCGYYQVGLQLSKQFTIAGYDVWNFGNVLSPGISTIAIARPLTQMGNAAADRLMARLSDEDIARPTAQVIACDCTLALPFDSRDVC